MDGIKNKKERAMTSPHITPETPMCTTRKYLNAIEKTTDNGYNSIVFFK